jgi:Carbohydrate family 9 binding domain-like
MMHVRSLRLLGVWYGLTALLATLPCRASEVHDGLVRAVIPRASAPLTIDGRLEPAEYSQAFCTPIEYFHPDAANRAAQFYYLWDDKAFYVGVRTLDQKAFSPEAPLWEGDAVEWYFDARRSKDFLSREWPKQPDAGAVHCFFTAMHLDQLEPRFTIRPGYDQAIPEEGVQVAATRTGAGLELEFKLPWANFPDFTPRAEEVIGLDAELSYSDGGPRSYRSFVFGSPLSVQQPANVARVKLVNQIKRDDWKACAPVLMPMRVDVPWSQSTEPHVVGRIAVPPVLREDIGRVVFRLTDLSGNTTGEFEAEEEVSLAHKGDFAIREARWPAEESPPGTYHATAIVFDADGKELARIAPRLVSVNATPGY